MAELFHLVVLVRTGDCLRPIQVTAEPQPRGVLAEALLFELLRGPGALLLLPGDVVGYEFVPTDAAGGLSCKLDGMNKTTIGRIVHFVDQGGEHRAALVTEVHTETCVSLAVFGTQGMAFLRSISEDEGDKRALSWHWPERE